jgi:hypothetical protein
VNKHSLPGIAVNREIFKRMLALILFLDQAKLAHIIPEQPCLFVRVSKWR